MVEISEEIIEEEKSDVQKVDETSTQPEDGDGWQKLMGDDLLLKVRASYAINFLLSTKCRRSFCSLCLSSDPCDAPTLVFFVLMPCCLCFSSGNRFAAPPRRERSRRNPTSGCSLGRFYCPLRRN